MNHTNGKFDISFMKLLNIFALLFSLSVVSSSAYAEEDEGKGVFVFPVW